MRAIDPKDANSVAEFQAWVREHRFVIAVDPGLQGTGIAVFHRETLIDAVVLTTASKHKSRSWPARADELADMLHGFCDQGKQTMRGERTIILCEMPEFQAGSARSMGWKTGDLQRLAYLVGLFAGRCREHHFAPVSVSLWKGQLPKTVVQERVTARIGAATIKQVGVETHAWDACGIGLWGLGRF